MASEESPCNVRLYAAGSVPLDPTARHLGLGLGLHSVAVNKTNQLRLLHERTKRGTMEL